MVIICEGCDKVFSGRVGITVHWSKATNPKCQLKSQRQPDGVRKVGNRRREAAGRRTPPISDSESSKPPPPHANTPGDDHGDVQPEPNPDLGETADLRLVNDLAIKQGIVIDYIREKHGPDDKPLWVVKPKSEYPPPFQNCY